MYKGYVIRIYPTNKQKEIIERHIGACRFIWNYMLNLQIQRYENKEKYLSNIDMCYQLTKLKKTEGYTWLYEINNGSLQRVCGILHESYLRTFNKLSHAPKFKSKKKSKTTYPLRNDKFYFTESCIQIPKLGKVKYKTDYVIPLHEKIYLKIYT